MVLRIALFAVPMAAVAGLVLLLNALEAQTGVAVAALGMVAVASGAALGYFADRLPELPGTRHRRHDIAAPGDRR
ncbi:MAG TPA: hypothetical protein VHE08_07095 [Solirubrobacterales bacterium]|nr:hypothetical protein [Solirubrobacterales bacterium]